MEVSAQRNKETCHSVLHTVLHPLQIVLFHTFISDGHIFAIFSLMLSLNIVPCIKDWYNCDHTFNRLYTTVTVKCCTLVSPVTVALFTGPSLSSEHVTQDPSATRDSERYTGEGLGQESESSDSDTEEAMREKKENNGVVFKVDDWIALSGNQEVINGLFLLLFCNPPSPGVNYPCPPFMAIWNASILLFS